MTREFKGVWIPKEIWLADDLSWTEKMLFVEIDSLCHNGECFATNEYFGKFFNLKKDTISKAISSLKVKGYVDVKLEYKEGTKQILRRIISTIPYRRKILEGVGEKSDTPIGKKSEDNNIDINNTNNNTPLSYESREVVELFNDICVSFPSVKTVTNERKKAIAKLLEQFTFDEIKKAFVKAEHSVFLKGHNKRGWRADFDFIINYDYFIKILEGSYDHQQTNGNYTTNNYRRVSKNEISEEKISYNIDEYELMSGDPSDYMLT